MKKVIEFNILDKLETGYAMLIIVKDIEKHLNHDESLKNDMIKWSITSSNLHIIKEFFNFYKEEVLKLE